MLEQQIDAWITDPCYNNEGMAACIIGQLSALHDEPLPDEICRALKILSLRGTYYTANELISNRYIAKAFELDNADTIHERKRVGGIGMVACGIESENAIDVLTDYIHQQKHKYNRSANSLRSRRNHDDENMANNRRPAKQEVLGKWASIKSRINMWLHCDIHYDPQEAQMIIDQIAAQTQTPVPEEIKKALGILDMRRKLEDIALHACFSNASPSELSQLKFKIPNYLDVQSYAEIVDIVEAIKGMSWLESVVVIARYMAIQKTMLNA